MVHLVIIASCSPVKYQAVKKWIEEDQQLTNVFYIKEKTCTKFKQPIGIKSGINHLQCRMDQIQRRIKFYEYDNSQFESITTIGIESFILKYYNTWFDTSAIYVNILRNDLTFIAKRFFTGMHEINLLTDEDLQIFEDVREGTNETTIGEMMHEKYGLPKDDWQRPKTRVDYIYEALVSNQFEIDTGFSI